MRESAATIRHECSHPTQLEARGRRRQQLLGHKDGPLRYLDHAESVVLGQRRENAPTDVANVRRALAQVGVGHLLDRADELLDHLDHGGLDVDLALPDCGHDLLV